MMCGLTNTDRNDNEAFRVYVASLRSGQNVKYIDAPIPPDRFDSSPIYSRNYHNGNFNYMASIVGFDGWTDYSAFWAEYWNIK